jgi:hypothetical protein
MPLRGRATARNFPKFLDGLLSHIGSYSLEGGRGNPGPPAGRGGMPIPAVRDLTDYYHLCARGLKGDHHGRFGTVRILRGKGRTSADPGPVPLQRRDGLRGQRASLGVCEVWEAVFRCTGL